MSTTLLSAVNKHGKQNVYHRKWVLQPKIETNCFHEAEWNIEYHMFRCSIPIELLVCQIFIEIIIYEPRNKEIRKFLITLRLCRFLIHQKFLMNFTFVTNEFFFSFDPITNNNESGNILLEIPQTYQNSQ